MRKLITTIALLAVIDTTVAIAQTVGSRNPSAPPPSTNPDKQLLPEAPVCTENSNPDVMMVKSAEYRV